MGNEASAAIDVDPTVTSVTLTNRSLKKVPPQLFELSLLTNLNLSRNEIRRLPEELFENKTALQTLFLNSNQLVSVPQSLSALSHCLTVLSIQKNGLRSVPEPILLLESLRELELQDNQIERVGSLERLCKLKDLNLNRNLVKHLDLRGVSELNSLNMCSNRLAQVPSPLPLTLRFLCLSENQIAKLEVENFVELKRIDTIMLDDNRLSDLPVELAKLTSLTLLDVRKNSIMSVDEIWHNVSFFYGDPPSQIVPGLLLGNVSASANRDLLLFHSVKAVVRAVDTSVQTENPFGDDFRYLWVDCLDVDEQDMRQFFENTNKFIGDTIDSGETVFVHCRQGKSRSVTLVVAFLMYSRGLSAEEALAFCKSRRILARPNPSFLRQLNEYQDELLAFL